MCSLIPDRPNEQDRFRYVVLVEPGVFHTPHQQTHNVTRV